MQWKDIERGANVFQGIYVAQNAILRSKHFNLIQSIMILCLAEGIYQPRALTLRQNAFLWLFMQSGPQVQPTEVQVGLHVVFLI